MIEALKEPARDRKKVKNVTHNGNVSFDDILKIAKTMREAKKSLSIDITGTVKEVLGTCVSLGCTVDGKTGKEMTALVEKGEV